MERPVDAVRELRRITRPAGRVVVVLNGEDHLRELRDLVARASEVVGAPLPPRPPRLTVEVGERLVSETFDSVTRVDVAAELVIPDAAPVMAYVRSMIGLQESDRVEAVAAAAERLLAAQRAADPVIRVTVRAGALICRDERPRPSQVSGWRRAGGTPYS